MAAGFLVSCGYDHSMILGAGVQSKDDCEIVDETWLTRQLTGNKRRAAFSLSQFEMQWSEPEDE